MGGKRQGLNLRTRQEGLWGRWSQAPWRRMLPCQYGSQVLICDSFPLDRLDLIDVRLLFLIPVPSPVSILQAELVRDFLFYLFLTTGHCDG